MDPAEWLLETRFRPWGGAHEFVGEVVDVETSKPLLVVDVYLATADREHVRHQVDGFVEKLAQALPTRSAAVASVSKGGVEIPLGAQDNVRTGMRFLFSSSRGKFFSPKAHEEQWIQGRVSQVVSDACLVRISPKDAASLVEAGDSAVLR